MIVLLGAVGVLAMVGSDPDGGRKFVPDSPERVAAAHAQGKKRPPEAVELVEGVAVVDCRRAPHRGKHILCTDKRLRPHRKKMLYFTVDLSGREDVAAVWLWRNECAQSAKLKRGLLSGRPKKVVETTECQARATFGVSLADPHTLLTEEAPDLHDALMANGTLVIPWWKKQGDFGDWVFSGWSLLGYPAGASQPEQLDTRPTAFERRSTPL